MKKHRYTNGGRAPFATNNKRNFYSSQYTFKELDTANLVSSQPYQRPVDPKHVRNIIDHFDPLYLDEILVSYRGGVNYVIDGQNRIAAFKQMNGGKNCLVTCKVFHGLTYEQEAEMFHHLDSIKKKLRICDTVRAKVEAGSDEDINSICRILSTYHIQWSYSGNGNRRGFTISSSRALIECYKELGEFLFETMVRLMVFTWHGSKDSMTSPFLKGLTAFVLLYAKEGDENIFVRKVGSHSPAEIKALAEGQNNSASLPKRYAMVFYEKYNHRATPATRLPYKF